MRKKLLVSALVACVFALTLGLVGCGGSGSGGADPKAAFTGTWDLVGMEEDGEVTSSDDLEMLKSLGLEVYLELNEDGSGALVLFGESMEATWDASSATAGTITMEGQSVNMTIANDQLTMEQDGSKLTFEKGEARTSSALSETNSASSSSDASTSSAAADSSTSNSTMSSSTESATANAAASTAESVPSEYKTALRKAQSYNDTMHMSKAGLYDQLTSEYGEKYSAEAAQYAVDNVNADWNANALIKAKNYRDMMDMSPAAIWDQLVSEYGEQFTSEEADYAIAHLDD